MVGSRAGHKTARATNAVTVDRITVETVAIHKLCQMLDSHSRLERKVRQCCSDRCSCGRER